MLCREGEAIAESVTSLHLLLNLHTKSQNLSNQAQTVPRVSEVIKEAHGVILESGAETESQSLLKTPANRKLVEPATVDLPSSPAPSQPSYLTSPAMQEPDFVTQSQCYQGPDMDFGSRPSTINPMGFPHRFVHR